MSDPTIVLVHGAWHGSWAWAPIVERLQARGIPTVAVDLPSSSDDPDSRGDLAADVATLRTACDDIDGPVVLVGHSYGGIPITQVAAGDADVAHLVYICAFMLDEGESLLGTLDHQVPDWIEMVEDGAATVANRPAEVFYADVDPSVAEDAAARLVPQSVASFADAVEAVGWRDVASTYVIAEQDAALPPSLQEQQAQRATHVERLDASHSPFLSQPEAVTDLLAGIASPSGT